MHRILEVGSEYLVKNSEDCVVVVVQETKEDSFTARIVYGYSVLDNRIVNYNKKVQQDREKYDILYADFYESVDVIDPCSDDYQDKLDSFVKSTGMEHCSIGNWGRIPADEQVLKDFSVEDVVFAFDEPGCKIRLPFNSNLTRKQVSSIMQDVLHLLDPFDYDDAIIRADETGVYYDVEQLLDICSKIYPEHDAHDIMYNGIISGIDAHKQLLEKEILIHFVRPYSLDSDEYDEESVNIDEKTWYYV